MNDIKDNRKAYYDIAKLLIIHEEVVTAMAACDDALKKLYARNHQSLEELFEAFSEKVRKEILLTMQKANLSIGQIQEVKEWIDGFADTLRKAEVVQVTLAIDLDDGLVSHLIQYFRVIFSDQYIVLEFHKKEAIMGGIQVVYRGHYLDFSLRQQLQNFFVKKKTELESMVALVA